MRDLVARVKAMRPAVPDLSVGSSLRARLAGLGLDLAALRQIKYAPDQPRVPAGDPDGGQWTIGVGGFTREIGENSNNILVHLASGSQYSFGTLITQLPYKGGGRYCVYKFEFGAVIVSGPNIAQCPQMMPSFGVTHGLLLNDNAPRW